MADKALNLQEYSKIIATISDNYNKGVYDAITLAGAPIDTTAERTALTHVVAAGNLDQITFFSTKEGKYKDVSGAVLTGEAEAAAKKLVEAYAATSADRMNAISTALHEKKMDTVFVDGYPISDDWKPVERAFAADRADKIFGHNSATNTFHDYKGDALTGEAEAYARGVYLLHVDRIERMAVLDIHKEVADGLKSRVYTSVSVDGKPLDSDWSSLYEAAVKGQVDSRVSFLNGDVPVTRHGIALSAIAEVEKTKQQPVAVAEPVATDLTKEKAESYAKALEGVLDIGRAQVVQSAQNKEGKTEHYILYNLAPVEKGKLDGLVASFKAAMEKAPDGTSLEVGVNAEAGILIFPVAAIDAQNKDGKYFERLATVKEALQAAYDKSGIGEKGRETPKEEPKATPQAAAPKAGIPLDKLEQLQAAIDKATKDAPLGIKVADLKPEQLSGLDKNKNKQIDGDELSSVIEVLRKNEAGSPATDATEAKPQGGGAKPVKTGGVAK